MENVIPTIYAAHLRTCLELNLPYNPLPNTTINEALGINETVTINPSDVFNVGYVAIGNGGHKLTALGTSYKTERVYHMSSDPVLFNHLPFIMRKVDEDLSDAEREPYGLRKIVSYGGQDYVAYYLKKLDPSAVTPLIELVDPTAGTKIPFAPTSSNLTPVPPTVDTPGTHVISDKYYTISANYKFSLGPADITEFMNAVDIIYGDPGYGVISEIAYCSGTAKTGLPGVGAGGAPIAYDDIVAVQPAAFIQVFYAMEFNMTGVETNLDIGVKEPLYETY